MGTDTAKRAPAQPVITRDPHSVRKRILDAAQTEFMQVGYERANTNRIVQLFGGSKATIFRHFTSKAALFEGVVRRITSTWTNQISWHEINRQDPEDWLTEFGTRALQWFLLEENLFLGRTAIAEGNSFPELRALYGSLVSQPIQALLSAKLREWTTARQIRSVHPERDALAYMDLVFAGPVSRSLYKVNELETVAQIRRHVKHSVGIFIHGIRSCSA